VVWPPPGWPSMGKLSQKKILIGVGFWGGSTTFMGKPSH